MGIGLGMRMVPSLSGGTQAPTISTPPVRGKGLSTPSNLPLLFRWGDRGPQMSTGDPWGNVARQCLLAQSWDMARGRPQLLSPALCPPSLEPALSRPRQAGHPRSGFTDLTVGLTPPFVSHSCSL